MALTEHCHESILGTQEYHGNGVVCCRPAQAGVRIIGCGDVSDRSRSHLYRLAGTGPALSAMPTC